MLAGTGVREVLIPGEPLWRPPRRSRWDYLYPNPAHVTARILLRIVLWAATAWLGIRWLTIGL